jgi:hypothetical protein
MFVDVTVDDLAEITLTIMLSNNTVLESLPVGGVVGTLSVYGGSGTEVFTITSDPSSMFSVSGNQLLVAGDLDFETAHAHFVQLSATGGLSNSFTISVIDVAEPLDLARTGFVDSVGEYFIEGEVDPLMLETGLDTRNNLIDSFVETVRNIALRDIHTTGTIAAASTSLTVASAAGLLVGDKIIVAVGGEAGGGLRGTVGVGGTWPDLSYADEAAMLADTTQPPNTNCWLRDTTEVWGWQWYGEPVWAQFPDTAFYHNSVWPKALVATITNIVGSVLTLDSPSFEAATAANVYLDNTQTIQDAIDLGGQFMVLTMPAGTFAISNCISFVGSYAGGQHGWTFKGAGRESTTLLLPDGVQISTGSALIEVSGQTNFTLRDYHLQSNFGLNGTIMPSWTYGYWTGFLIGNLLDRNYDSQMINVKGTDCCDHPVWSSFGFSVWMYNCKTVLSEPTQLYIGWDLGNSDSAGGGCVDCQVESTYYKEALEFFGSRGSMFLRCNAVNGYLALNSAECKILDCTLTMQAGKRLARQAPHGPIININTNIHRPVSLPTLIRNTTIVQEGFGSVGGVDVMMGIIVNADNDHVTIQGGSYTAPPFTLPYDGATHGPVGINSDGMGCFVYDFTCLGETQYDIPSGNGSANINVTHGTIQDCTATSIRRPEDCGTGVSDPPSSGNTVTYAPAGGGSW